VNEAPIFIHSLFRAGSTYLFDVFRRSTNGYWCYQEPLHELSFFCREDPSRLEIDHGPAKMRLLRHPQLNAPYFLELQETWPAWKNAISEDIIYNAYFSPFGGNIGIAYWQALASAARGRPVFQECRTAGRIGAIRNHMGGYHIYLWRNPWDEWWSYKVSPYFDVVNQLIIHAHRVPQPVRCLLAGLALPAYGKGDLSGAFSFYAERPQSSEQSYLIFYLLWCLGMQEGQRHADLVLSIDRLTDSADYQTVTQSHLTVAGIDGICFSDCRIPQGHYLDKECAHFRAMEGRVHQWLIEGGWSQQDIDRVEASRRQYEPASWNAPFVNLTLSSLAEQTSRARDLARRLETTLSERARDDELKLGETVANMRHAEDECRAQVAEARAQRAEAESRAQVVEAKAQRAEAESRAQVVEARAQRTEAESRAQVAEARARVAEAESRAQVAEATTRLVERRLEVLGHEFHAVQKSNHKHWQELEATRKELQEIHHCNHRHWLLAEARAGEIRALHSSYSWRITAPLRAVAAAIMRRDQSNVASPSAASFADCAIRRAMAHPRLVAGVHRTVDALPWLRAAITTRVARAMYSVGTVAHDSSVSPRPTVDSRQRAADLSSLTPHARRIHADLESALAIRREERGR